MPPMSCTEQKVETDRGNVVNQPYKGHPRSVGISPRKNWNTCCNLKCTHTQCCRPRVVGVWRSGYCLRRKNPHPGWVGGWVGGWIRGPKKVCVPKISLKFPAPLINFIYCLRKIFSDVVGWVGRPGLARAPNPPPPLPGSLSNSLVAVAAVGSITTSGDLHTLWWSKIIRS